MSPLEIEQKIQAELTGGERLLWSGMPQQGIQFRPADIFMVPFSLLWGGFAVFWEYSAVSQGAPFFFMLWGIPFVLVGLYIIIVRFFADSYLRARTYYGVTDRRILILSGLVNREVKSLTLQTLNDISIKERQDGSGSIVFGPTNPLSDMWSGSGWPGTSGKASPSFDLIHHARRTYDLIQEAQRKSLRT